MKVLLIQPPLLYCYNQPGTIGGTKVKLHLISLYSYLKRDFEVKVLDFENEIGDARKLSETKGIAEKAKKLLRKQEFDVAAVSCWSSTDYLSSVMLAEECKKINPNCVVVVGGYHASALPSDFTYKNSPFDYVVVGEGEQALKEICLNPVKREKTRVIQAKALSPSEWPELDWKGYKYKEKEILRLPLSRGCPFHCSYCMERAKSGGGNWRALNEKEAIKQIRKGIDEVSPKVVSFSDVCFGANPEWKHVFLESLIKENFDATFWVETRVDLTTKKDLDLFSRANALLNFGLESLSVGMLELMKKTPNPQEYIKNAFKISSYCNKIGLVHQFYFIFGFPGDSKQNQSETLKALERMVKANKRSFLAFKTFVYALFPGSFVYKNLGFYEQKYGTKFYHKQWWKERGDQNVFAQEIDPSSSFKLKDKDFWVDEIKALTAINYFKVPENEIKKTMVWRLFDNNLKDLVSRKGLK